MWCRTLVLSSRGVRTERPDVSCSGSGSQWSSSGHSGVAAASSGHILFSLSGGRHQATPAPTVQLTIPSGTLLHADGIDSAAGCRSQTCKVVETGHSTGVS